MASLKYYLQNAAPGYTPTAVQGTWDDATPAVDIKLGATKSGTPATANQGGSSVNPNTAVISRCTTDALADAVTFPSGGAWSGVIGILEGFDAQNLNLRLTAWVTQGDSSTPRGVLFSDYDDPDEASTSSLTAGEGCSGTFSATVAAQVGDRIVLEIGGRWQSTDTQLCTWYYGSTGADAIADGSPNVGWIQFGYAAAYSQTSSAVSASVASIVRSANLTRLAVSASVASLEYTRALVLSATSASVASVSRSVSLTRSATSTAVGAITKGITKTLSAISAAVGYLSWDSAGIGPLGDGGTCTFQPFTAGVCNWNPISAGSCVIHLIPEIAAGTCSLQPFSGGIASIQPISGGKVRIHESSH